MMAATPSTTRQFQIIRVGRLLLLFSILTVPRYISSFLIPSDRIIITSSRRSQIIPNKNNGPVLVNRQCCLSNNSATTTTTTITTSTSKLYMSNMNSDDDFFTNDDTNDPFQVLGLNEPTSDLKVIRRAYKRMALKYHPDVATTKDSTMEQKKMASERFAKINWAYETLSGKRKDDTTYGKAKTTTTTTGSSSNSWTPPHRRNGGGSYSSSSSSSSTKPPSWEDFMPKYDDEQYDTGGDSFEKIFTDIFVGAAAGAAGIGGGGPNIFKDFVEFLEGNVDMGFVGVSSSDDDSDLRILLATGSIEEIGNEMDDTELVIESLKSKKDSMVGEIMDRQADLSLSNRYIEKMDLQENIAELQARKEVVDGYLKKAQKRLVKIQNRYKELIVSGQNDTYARGGGSSSSSSWRDSRTESGYSSSTRPGARASSSSASNSGYSSTSPSDSSTKKSSGDGDSWMDEGFGSSSGGGRRRASSRRSRSNRSSSSSSRRSSSSSSTTESQRRTTASSDSSQSNKREAVRPPPSSTSSRRSPPAAPTPSQTATPISTDVPPHRRRQSTFQSEQETKRRLRDLKVDDEFEKLKKDLGL